MVGDRGICKPRTLKPDVYYEVHAMMHAKFLKVFHKMSPNRGDLHSFQQEIFLTITALYVLLSKGAEKKAVMDT